MFWLLLSLAYAIPQTLVDQHLQESINILESEGDYPYDIVSTTGYDNFTAAIMLEQCMTKSSNPFMASLSNEYFAVKGQPMVAALQSAMDGSVSDNYARYWHGYVAVLKPLLLFFNIQEIRVILQTMFLIICGIASIYICRIFKHGGLGLSFLFLLSAGLLSSLKAASDLPLFFSFFIMAAGIVVVLRIKPNNLTANGPYWFFAIGAATVYFDFLDTPIITLGVPLIIYLLRLLNEGFSIRKITFSIVTVAVLWAVGYGYLWCLKWCLAALVLGPSVVASALKAATFRLGIDQASAQYGTSPLEAIQINFSHLGFTKYVMILAVLVSVVFISILVIRSLRLRESLSPAYFGSIIMLVIVAMLPYLWYLIFSNHSCIHSWFVYRDQIVSLFALCSLAWYLGCRVFSESAEEKRKKILP